MGITKISAETQKQTAVVQVSAERIFHVMGKGNVDQIKERDRRQFRFSPYEPTGLYASPNEKITIQVGGTQNIQAYIGTFSYDASWNEDSVIKSFTLKPGENTIESSNGGMIYLYNPQMGGTVQAEIKKGGVPTPFFELGKNTKQDLINMLDTYPNAHAVELKGERSLITASPERVKKYLLDSHTDPVELLKKIDEAIRIEDRVSGLSEEQADKHYVHFVEDNHSKGFMYSYNSRTAYIGDAIKDVLDINRFTKNGWGPWHEAGHQRQQSPWKWKELGEVTVNIYSMSVQRAFGNPSRLENGTYEKALAYLNKPQSEKDYNKINDNFEKLVMFWQLDLAFGEDFYPKLHQLYRSVPKEELPKTDDEKIQGFIYNTSKVAKENLLPFFDKWGLKATPETRQKIEALNYPILTAPIWESTDSKPVKANVLKLGGRVWEDNNQNGIQDQSEKGLEGIRVQLLNKDGNASKEVKTDKEGRYLFDGLTENTYRVQIEKPSDYVFTPKQNGQDVTVNSNLSETGVTGVITLLHDDLTIDAGINRNIFKDVPQGHWAFNAIHDLANKGIIAGYGNGIFGMGDNVTREQVAALIYRTLHIEKQSKNENPYGDIDKNSTMFPEEILALTKLGIFQGDDQRNFRPKAILTRAEMAQVITKSFKLDVKAPHNFNDVPENSWAKDAISAVQSNHVAAGVGEGKFAPDMEVTREQYAQFLYNAILNEQSH
ncbi:M60 family metallopeptidase [Bacillus cereus]|uniref:M60 family metallopeptidase n=1 Tax=Bacillus cereus TaxID=1396 RepID=UPI002ABEAF84|nr:M60 family metallopeptidase [Bacillus cereus]MDZ4406749.1 M60 family metallopeptidase [Bacillus cereus]MDZ4533984.1 M60 family metallopeptidase [Bacillus cereus]